MLESGISVVIPTIPPRAHLLQRALTSVEAQTFSPAAIIVESDPEATGSSATRNRALERVETEWVAMLDDDDELLPHHLEKLHATAVETGADLVYSIYSGINEWLYHKWYWQPFDIEVFNTLGNFIPITCLIRTEPLLAVGGFSSHPAATEHDAADDFGTWTKLLAGGAKFVHHPEITWVWHGHDWRTRHTSGRPWNR